MMMTADPGAAPLLADDMAGLLEGYFRKRFPHAMDIVVRDYAPLTGGLSRHTASFAVMMDGAVHRFIARSDPPDGSVTTTTDRDAEWALLSALSQRGGVPMPCARFYDADGSELGAKTIIIDFVEGGTVSAHCKRWNEAQKDEFADKLCGLLASIHAVNPAQLPPSVSRPVSWHSYIDDHLERARRIEAEHIEPDPLFSYMIAWLDRNRPQPAPLTLVHGELQASNIMCDPDGKLLAVDWEFAHVGDPREDIGWCRMVEALHEPVLIRRDESRFLAEYRALSQLEEDVINPDAIAWFMILAGMNILGGLYRSIAQVSEGATHDYRTAFVTGALVTAHREWLEAARRVDANRLAGQAAC